MLMLGYVPVIEIGDAKVKDYVEQEWKIENDEVHSIIFKPHLVLHSSIDTKNPKRLYQQVKREE